MPVKTTGRMSIPNVNFTPGYLRLLLQQLFLNKVYMKSKTREQVAEEEWEKILKEK